MDTTLDLSVVDVQAASPLDKHTMNSDSVSIQELLDRFMIEEDSLTPQDPKTKQEDLHPLTKAVKNIRIRISKGPAFKENGYLLGSHQRVFSLTKSARTGITLEGGYYSAKMQSEKDLGLFETSTSSNIFFNRNMFKKFNGEKEDSPQISSLKEAAKVQKKPVIIKKPMRSATQTFEIKKKILLPSLYQYMKNNLAQGQVEENCPLTASIAAMLQEKHDDVFEKHQEIEKKSSGTMGHRKLFMPIQGQLKKINTINAMATKTSELLQGRKSKRSSTWMVPPSLSKNSSVISFKNSNQMNESIDLKADKTLDRSLTSRKTPLRRGEEELN